MNVSLLLTMTQSQPIQSEVQIRSVHITCFSCKKDIRVQLKSWELEKDIICPICSGKEVVIRTTV